jgi:pyruvate dehydrogenase phosphatase
MSLQSLLARGTTDPDLKDTISRLLREAIVETDQALTNDFLRLFPRNAGAVSRLNDRTISAILKSEDKESTGKAPLSVKRCLQGTTVLLTLVDPSRENMWMSNLGDCRAGESALLASHHSIPSHFSLYRTIRVRSC